MRRVAAFAAIVLGSMTFTTNAPAQDRNAESGCEQSGDVAEDQGFDARVLRYARAVEFTRRLEAQRRDEREFEESADRYARLVEFTKSLEFLHEIEREMEFNNLVVVYARAHQFMKKLIEQRRRDVAPEPERPGADHSRE